MDYVEPAHRHRDLRLAGAVYGRLPPSRPLTQVAAGNSNLPAIAGVVGFKIRLILLAELKT